MSRGQKNSTIERHVAQLGVPIVYADDDVCLLHQRTHIAGYSNWLTTPLWVGYTLKSGQREGLSGADCLRPDVRLSLSTRANCSHLANSNTQNLTLEYLFPPNLSGSSSAAMDGMLGSNVVPMTSEFSIRVWGPLHSLIKQWADKYGTLHVFSGPIFDYNHDGLYDRREQITNWFNDKVPVPTHVYVIVARCETTQSSFHHACAKFSAMAFVLPNVDRMLSCQVCFYNTYIPFL